MRVSNEPLRADGDERTRPRVRRPQMKTNWWDCHLDGTSPHGMIISLVKTMRTQQRWRFDAYNRWARAYGENISQLGVIESVFDEERSSTNHLANLIDTLHAEVFKNRILPMPMTTGGDYMEFKRAQRLGRFLEGLFDEIHFFDDLQLQLGLFVLVCGDGWLKGYRKDGRFAVDVVPPWDIYLDEVEARYGKPRSIMQRMLFDKHVLFEDYCDGPNADDESLYGTSEERAYAIETASRPGTGDEEAFQTDYNGDQVVVTEAWHLPSGPDAGDGRHVICVDGGTLLDEPWTRASFPIRSMKAGITMMGARGPSQVARILPLQNEHDKLSQKLQDAHALVGVPRVVFQKGSKVSIDHINDQIGSIMTCDGPPPTVANWEPVHSSTYAYRNGLREEMSAEIGVSQFTSEAQLPPGMSGASGKAIQLVADVDSGRQAIKHKLLQRLVLDFTDMALDECEAIADDDPDFAVTVCGKGTAEELRFADVRVDRKKLHMKISPVSALSKDPSARFDQLMKLRESKEISSEEFRYMFEMPDLERMNGIAISDIESVDWRVERMVFENEYREPSPVSNFDVCIKRASQLYDYFDKQGGVPDDRMQKILQFIKRAAELKARAAEPPPQPAGPVMPPAAGAALPMPGDMPMPAASMAPPMMGAPPPVQGIA